MPRRVLSFKMTILRNIGIVATCIALIIGCYFSYVSYFQNGNCHLKVDNPINYMATKAPYVVDYTPSLTKISEDCIPQQIWILIRHGTRNPSADVILNLKKELPSLRDKILENHEAKQGELCDNEIISLKEWNGLSHLDESKEKILVSQGSKEMAGIASRFKKRFPKLFADKYSNTTFKFKYTKTQRTAESATAFTQSLFAEDHRNVIYPEAVAADPIIRFYKGCPKWKETVNKNPEAYLHQKLFEVSTEFQGMLQRVTQRLGFESSISKDQAVTMYLGCSFETAWNPELVSPWCSIFDKQDLKVLEYHQDLDYYYIDGYGFEISYKVACPAVNDIISHFEDRMKKKDEDDFLNVIAYFTHSGTSLKLLARLGLFNDSEPLRNDNFQDQVNRKWRTSVIDTFASNLAVILHKCPKEYRVSMLFQESKVPLPYCNDQFHCSFEEFRSSLNKAIGTCDIKEMCQIP